ncbi:MAG: hypothetical protein ABIC19_02485 [Patescibacteria group bacterium]|nr:hypothetical protein [Patescibacteria group bacterium]
MVKKAFGDNIIRFFAMMSVVINIIAWLLAVTTLMRQPSPIVLHYNAYFGVDIDGDRKWSLLLPGTGLIILTINYALALYFFKKSKLAARIFVGTAFLFNLIINLGIVTLIFVNRV